jgi:hypothetical protein
MATGTEMHSALQAGLAKSGHSIRDFAIHIGVPPTCGARMAGLWEFVKPHVPYV